MEPSQQGPMLKYRDLHLMWNVCAEFHLHLQEESGEFLPIEKKETIKAIHQELDQAPPLNEH